MTGTDLSPMSLREAYGQHKCDESKVITKAQVNDDGTRINDCLGHPNGTMVDNIEDVDVEQSIRQRDLEGGAQIPKEH